MTCTRGLNPALLLAALAAASLAVTACDGSGRGSGELLARAGSAQFSVEEAAQLLATQNELPNQPEVAMALADLWIDYTLLAKAANRDSTLASVDLRGLVKQQMEQELVFRLREEVVQVDTSFTEEELREIFSREGPGASVRARHILVTFPQGASPAQRDSVRTFMEGLRSQLAAGADFAALAREHSEDPGSAANGGDLGFFQRGMMVAPFDSAAFSLQPGELSGIVESPYGLHVLRVEERQSPSFEENGQNFRMQYVQELIARAEREYIEGIEGPANVRVVPGALTTVRELAQRPQYPLSRRAEARPVVEFTGGRFTAGDLQEWMQAQAPALRSQIQQAPDDALEGLLGNLTRGRLLVAEAERRGLSLTREEEETLLTEARNRFVQATRALGLFGLTTEAGETMDQAIQRSVHGSLEGILSGDRDVIPLGTIAYSLRRGQNTEVFDRGVELAVTRVDELRGPSTSGFPPGLTPPAGMPPGQGMPLPPPSSAPNAPDGEGGG